MSKQPNTPRSPARVPLVGCLGNPLDPEDWSRHEIRPGALRWKQIQVEQETRPPSSPSSVAQIESRSRQGCLAGTCNNPTFAERQRATGTINCSAAIRPLWPTLLAHSICPAGASYWQRALASVSSAILGHPRTRELLSTSSIRSQLHTASQTGTRAAPIPRTLLARYLVSPSRPSLRRAPW